MISTKTPTITFLCRKSTAAGSRAESSCTRSTKVNSCMGSLGDVMLLDRPGARGVDRQRPAIPADGDLVDDAEGGKELIDVLIDPPVHLGDLRFRDVHDVERLQVEGLRDLALGGVRPEVER